MLNYSSSGCCENMQGYIMWRRVPHRLDPRIFRLVAGLRDCMLVGLAVERDGATGMLIPR